MLTSNSSKILILGGARSGKSRYAEELAIASNQQLIYIATATVFDDEMQQRVKQHKKDRQSQHWKTVEEPLALANAIQQHDNTGAVILVDCLTMWLNNLFAEQDQTRLATEFSALLECLNTIQGSLIFVSNEVGQGIVPLGKLSRQFVDESGRLHQQLAQQVDRVVLMVAGLPLVVKG
jgi:adenosylcobinamide kinase/adenosylcobinamide-phosphate guanylyltransferase